MPARACAGTVLLLGVSTLLAPPAMAQAGIPRPDAGRQIYEVILAGNTGAGPLEHLQTTLDVLRRNANEAGSNSAVVFAGDLLPCCGFPEEGAPERGAAERRLMVLVEAVRDFEGRVVIVPGDQDWDGDPVTGWQSLLRLEEFLEAAIDRGDVFLPENGLPGPQHVRLTNDLRLVALNTQWLLTDGERPTGDAGDYDVEEDDDFYVELEDLIAKRSSDDLIVIGHHPLESNGRYGGHYPPRTHFFPLTMAWEHAYVPLPVIGTMALTLRRSLGSEQHFAHTRNEWMRDNLERLLVEHEDFVYVSAHDHSLQLHESGSVSDMQKYVVTGSAGRVDYVADGHDAEWVFPERGFVSLHYYDDGSVWSEAWGIGPDGAARMLMETQLREPRLVPERERAATPSDVDYSDSTLVVAPEPGYDGGWFRRFAFGSNHRDVWSTPVEISYIDLSSEHGGLTPSKRGGGMQTVSIRLEDPLGRQYVLRSVNKDAQRALPDEWKNTLAAPISQELVSKAHPHAAFAIPPLAEAAGVFHTNPRMVWVPDDPRLGPYRDLAGNMLMLFEERPDDDMSHAPSFGRSSDVIGAPDMYRRVTRDNDHRVDARAYARARLFDLWISDWDRHKDQWRWAAFDDPDGRGTIYRPVPRDRDQAFLRLDFFGHRLVKPFLRFQDFRSSYGSVKGLTLNATEQDHRFLAPLSRDDWQAIADSLQEALTDEVIESAFRLWPAPVFDLHGAEMVAIAKARRDQLNDVAEEFYRLHARSVDVVGSDKHERFEVTRLNDDSTQVVLFKISRDGEVEQELWRRTVWHGETDEIVLYGLAGDDRFIVRGEVDRGVMVRAVGGTGDDAFEDRSRVGRRGRKTHFLDSRESDWSAGPDTRIEVAAKPEDAAHTGFYTYDWTYPFGALWYTKDDGLVLAGGGLRTVQGFGHQPYAALHRLGGSVATGTGAWRLNYAGTAKERLGDWDVGIRLSYANPDNVRNFYGLGNEASAESALDSVRVRLGQSAVEVPLTLADDTGFTLRVAPRLARTDVRDDQPIDAFEPQPGLSSLSTAAQWHAGLAVSLDLEYVDDPLNPRQGYRWTSSAGFNVGLGDTPDNFTVLASDLALYTSLRTRRQATLGLRFGGAHTFGTFPFFEANALGGSSNLRGYRATRFTGRSSLFTNAEARLELFSVGGTILPGTVAALGLLDVGRVWTDGETSSRWHSGYGGGLWYSIAGEIVIRLTRAWSGEDSATLFGAGFFF